MKPVRVTTSWDDGHKFDIRLAELLKKYGLQGTFYVSPKTREFPENERLTPEEVKQLSKNFEVGAHTMTHPHLDELDAQSARKEIIDSKKALEEIIGKPVTSFCYPYGDFNDETKKIVAEAGFARARSVNRFVTRSLDRYAIGTSVDTFDHRRDGILSVLKLCGNRPWRVFTLRKWDNLAKEMFAIARERQEVFHLWGHSHEIDKHQDWERLENFFLWLSQQPDVSFVRNCDLPTAVPRLLVTAPYFKPRSGGLESYAFQIAKGLQDDKGWQVSVVTSGDPEELQHHSYKGVRVTHLPYKLRLSNTPFGFGWRRALKQIIASERPDVIITHAPVVGMMDITASIAKKTPLIITYHFGSMVKGSGATDIAIKLYERLLLPRAFRKARGIICSSEFVRTSDALRPYSAKSRVINPGVDTSIFTPPEHMRTTGHTLMHVGGLKAGEEHKGLATSLKVTAQLLRKYPDVQLTIVGNGDRESFYAAMVKELGIENHVTFTGRLSGQELVGAFQDADVLLLPSRTESFGMVIVEAMACGVPIVASDVDGTPEVVRSGETGFLVQPEDVTGFAARVSELFDNAEMAATFSRSARRIAIAEYQWSDKVSETQQYVSEVIDVGLDDRSPVIGINPTKELLNVLYQEA